MYGIEIFWNLIQDKSGLPEKHYETCREAFTKLLKQDNFECFREYFLK